MRPNTDALMSAVPIPDSTVEKERRWIILEGDILSPTNPPTGCGFNTRFPRAEFPKYSDEIPELTEVDPNHGVACHFPEVQKVV